MMRYSLTIRIAFFISFFIFLSRQPVAYSYLEVELLPSGEGRYEEALETFMKDREAAYNARMGDMYNQGKGVVRDSAEAKDWYEKAALGGNARAKFNLGVMYENGVGVKEDKKEAARWYLDAAMQGYARAQHNLGVLYFKGEGVEKDMVESARWYIKAAKQGIPASQFNVGLKYYKGEGIAKNMEEGLRWMHKAAAQGYLPAIEALKKIGSWIK